MADRSVTVFLKASVSGYIASIEQAKLKTVDFAKAAETSATTHKESWDKVGKGMLIAGGVIGAGVGMAVKAAAEFDHQMSVVQANVDNKSAPSMQRLADAAMSAGKSTMFSATQAAAAENELAKAGLTASEITGGALTGALSLASAGQIDLAQSAEIAATTMTQFGLSAKDVPHIADLLAAGADKALGGVTDLAEAMKYSGVVAHQFGISIETSTGILSMFAMNGLLGSMAGTGFREMLVRLAKPTAEGASEMRKLGITTYDASGKFLGMSNLAEQLKTKLSGLSQQQQQSTLIALFGQRAMAEGNILMKAGAAGVDEWTKKVNDQGFAALQASTKLNNLNGDLTILKTSLNVALIQGGQGAQGPLRTLTQDLTGVVNMFASLPAPMAQAVVAVAGVAAATLLLGGAAIMTTTRIAGLKAGLVGMGVEGEKATTMMKGFGAAATTVAVAIPLLNAANAGLDSAFGQGLPGAHEAARALLEFSTAGKVSGDSADLINVQFAELGNTVHNVFSTSFGHNLNAVAQAIDPNHWFAESQTSTSKAITFFKTLDSGMSAMVTSGHAEQAAALFKRVSGEVTKQGYSMAQLADVMPQYAAAVTSGTAANDGSAASIAKVAQAQAKAEETMLGYGVNVGAVGSAMRILGKDADAASTEVKALAKTIQGDMDAAAKAFASDTNVLGSYDPSKQVAAVTAAQDALNKARKAAGSSKSGKSDASVNNAQIALDKARQDQANASLSASYATQIKAGKRFVTDINAVTRAGLDPTVIARLLQEGPAKAAPALQAMLGNNSATMIKMVNDSEKALSAINARVMEQARLTSMAVNSSSDQMTKDFSAAMQIDNAIATSGGKATVLSLARELHVGVADVRRIAAEFGIGIGDGVAGAVRPAQTAIQKVQATIDSLRQGHIPGMAVNTAAGKEMLADLQRQIDALKGKNIVVTTTLFGQRVAQGTGGGSGGITRAGGGPITGVGGPTEDNIPIWGSVGEFMVNAKSYAKHSGLVQAINADKLAGGGPVGINLSLPKVSAIQAALNAAPPPMSSPAFSGGSGGSGGNAANKAIMQAMATSRFGWGSELGALNYLMMRESGYSNTAQNPTSTAYGMGQFLDSTWAGYGPKTSDPNLQSLYTLEYIQRRYHDPAGAAAHEQAFNWYGTGTNSAAPGWGVVGERGAELVKFNGGEQVIPNQHLAGGGLVQGLATGGFVTADMSSMGSHMGATPPTVASIAALRLREARATTALAVAENNLYTLRHTRGHTARQISIDEDRLTVARGAATGAVNALNAAVAARKVASAPFVTQWHASAGLSNAQTARFLSNIGILNGRGFHVLADQLVMSSDANAYGLAAAAVANSGTAKALTGDMNASVRNASALAAQQAAVNARYAAPQAAWSLPQGMAASTYGARPTPGRIQQIIVKIGDKELTQIISATVDGHTQQLVDGLVYGGH